MRGLYQGHIVNSKFWAKLIILSNYALKGHAGDTAMTFRLKNAIPMTAYFDVDATEDNMETGVFVAKDNEKILFTKLGLALLFYAQCARDFADAGFKLPPPPSGEAREEVNEARVGAPFETYVKDNYMSTARPNGKPGGDWETHGEHTLTAFSDILAAYNNARDRADPATVITSMAAQNIMSALKMPVARQHHQHLLRQVRGAWVREKAGYEAAQVAEAAEAD